MTFGLYIWPVELTFMFQVKENLNMQIIGKHYIYVAVPDRNRILFRSVFRAHHRVWCAIALSFHLGRGSYALCGCIRYSCIYIVCISPTLSGSSALQRIKLGDALEIRNGMIFDFYSRLPHIHICVMFIVDGTWQIIPSLIIVFPFQLIQIHDLWTL